MEDKYAGKVWAVYKNVENPFNKWGTDGILVSLFDSADGAERYMEARLEEDRYRGEKGHYSSCPWLVQRG